MTIQLPNGKIGENYNRLLSLEPKLAKKFARMPEKAREIAVGGIERHFNACLNNDINPDSEAIGEVLKNALNGRRAYC